jgi:hypothetical protein
MKINSETSRIRAALVNSGHYDFSEAEKKLTEMRLTIHVTPEAVSTPAGQAAALTAVLTATRCFGEVALVGDLDAPLLLPLPLKAKTLKQASRLFGAKTRIAQRGSRHIVVGPGQEQKVPQSVWAIWNGWSAGVAPSHSEAKYGRSDCPLAGISAGALAVAQSFLAEQGDVRAGKTTQGISLWSPAANSNWFNEAGPEYKNVSLPDALWLVGLGNLGQAYLWSLTWLPYRDAAALKLFLQDDDIIGEENWGTSVLVRRGRYGVLKTRAAEEWADAKGFRVRRIDRRLDDKLRRTDLEPAIALAGLDRMPPRRLLGLPGFEYVIDAGLGATAQTYRQFRLNVFDKQHDPGVHFKGIEDDDEKRIAAIRSLPAYREHERQSADGGCGTAELAGQSVAVPFVGAFVGALAVTQAIRIASGFPHYMTLTGEVGDLRSLRSALGQKPQRPTVGSIAPESGT